MHQFIRSKNNLSRSSDLQNLGQNPKISIFSAPLLAKSSFFNQMQFFEEVKDGPIISILFLSSHILSNFTTDGYLDFRPGHGHKFVKFIGGARSQPHLSPTQSQIPFILSNCSLKPCQTVCWTACRIARYEFSQFFLLHFVNVQRWYLFSDKNSIISFESSPISPAPVQHFQNFFHLPPKNEILF